MATEAVTKDMYTELIEIDKRLHNVLSLWKSKEKNISLKELQQHISTSLPVEVEDTTKLIQDMREKDYG